MTSGYTPSIESLKFIAFIRAAGVEDNANAEIHYKLADKYFSRSKQVVVEAFRGSAKSSLMEWFIIYTAAMGELPGFGEVGFIAFIGDSMENGVKNTFRNIAGKVDRSEFLRKVVTITRKTDSEMELVNSAGKELYLKGYGASTNIRGVRYKGLRPSVAIMDDVTSTEAGTSDSMLKTIEENFFKSIVPALHPTRYKIFYIATPVSENDLLHKLINNKEWTVHKFPICERFPCSKEDFVGAWEDRFPYEAVLAKYTMFKESGQEQAFAQEYMMEVVDLSTLLVEEDDVMWFDPAMILKNKGYYNYYISTDFATSTKKSADFSTIGVWAISSNNDWLLVDGQCRRQTMQENIEDLFKFVRKWKPLSVGIESSGQQGGFLSIIEEMKMERNIWFQFAKKPGSKEFGIRPTKDKMHRFVTGVQPKFKQNKVWFPRPEIVKTSNYRLFELVEEMVSELSKFTMSSGVKALKHDDCGTYDTIVDTPTGSKLLGEVVDGDEVIGFGPRGSVVCKVKDVRTTGIKPIVNIETEDGTILRFSEFHPMLTDLGYVLARDLQLGDKLVRNKEWKTKLSMPGIVGLENRQDTINQQLDVLQEKEKTGYISSCMRSITERLVKGTKFITKMKTRIITVSKTLSYLVTPNTELSMQSRIELMAIGLLIMWQRISMKCKSLLRKEKPVHTQEKTREKNFRMNQSNALTAETSLHRIKELEKILSAAVINAEMSGIISMQNLANAKSVEQYSRLVLVELNTVAQSAEVKLLKELLEETLSTYALCAEKVSLEHHIRLAVEKNAQEIGRMNLSENTEKIKKIWISDPEQTYNFEVEELHNYQVHNGFVVHNCIDLLNQLSEMETYAPSEEAFVEQTVVHEDSIWIGALEDSDDLNGFGGSTVF